ncbi:MAG TPA: S9 family peptidase [Candidatus Eisenbacteria bacterium]|nr:S9 family peptidase [Candidatus Eisenbacteria bacterium]
MREQDLLKLVWVADPQISPDGSRVLFTRVAVDADADEYVTSVWLADVEHDEVRALTYGRGDSQPRWSPDGRRVAFIRSPGPKQPGQLAVLPLEGGEARVLTTLAKGASEPAWSPDGARIAFLSGTNPQLDSSENKKPKHEPARVVTRPEFRMNDKGFRDPEHLDHVWVIDARGGEPRALTTGTRFEEASPRWSRDGRAVLFLSDRREEPWFGPDHAALYAVSPGLAQPTTGEALELVASVHGPIRAFVEREDGAYAAVGGIWPEQPRSCNSNDVLLFEPGPLPRRAPRVLTKQWGFEIGDGINSDQHPPRGGGAMPLAFADGGRAVLTVAAKHGAAMLARVDVASGVLETLTDDQHEVACGSVSADGTRVAVTLGSVRNPGVLALWDGAARTLRTLWDPNAELLENAVLGSVESFWYPSFDGQRIQAWLVKPPGFDPARKHPLVLEIHGGPHTAYGVGFFHEFHVLAEAGYLVLYTNPRGSTTYGAEFGNCIQYKYPGEDYDDLMAGVDAVIARGGVDESRLGVTGGSGGGLLTNWIVTKTRRFAAAITQRCVADWASMYYACDFAMFQPFWFRGAPFQDMQDYLARSPVTYADRIETPLMVIHSEEDWRTPIAQGEAMFRTLKHQGKRTVMVRFPGESHELSRSGTPSHRVQNQQHIRRFFDHLLLGQPAPEYELELARAAEPEPVAAPVAR